MRAGSATLWGNTYDGNTTDLVRQACGEASAPDGFDDESLGTTELCPDYDYLTQTLEYTVYFEESHVEF